MDELSKAAEAQSAEENETTPSEGDTNIEHEGSPDWHEDVPPVDDNRDLNPL